MKGFYNRMLMLGDYYRLRGWDSEGRPP